MKYVCSVMVLFCTLTVYSESKHHSFIAEEYFLLSQNLEQNSQKEKAIEYYKKSIEIDTSHSKPNCKLAAH